MSIEGTVMDVRGAVFDLLSSTRIYVVQTDSVTSVDGSISEGSIVTVEGVLSANNRLHATRVTVRTSVNPAATPDASPESADGAPIEAAGESTRTPRPNQPGTTKTPGPPDKTRTPGPPATPPGQSGQSGMSDASDDGS
jgi:hypothetical protein